MNGQFWQAIHGSIPLEAFKPAVLTPEQKKILNDFRIPLKEVYYIHAPVLNPLVWYHEGVYRDIMLHPEILKQQHFAEAITYLRSKTDELLAQGDWYNYFAMVEKKVIIPVLIHKHKEIPKEKLYDVFIEVWTRAETGFEMFTEDVLRYIYGTRKLSKEWTKRIRKFKTKVKPELKKCPDGKERVLVYHGEQNGDYNPGDQCSWTLSRKTAEFFAYRFNNEEFGEVQERMILPKEALDYLTNRNEDEVMLWPEEWSPL